MTYLNPVYPHSCPDPFVLKFCGEYWCYFTGVQPDGRSFGILRSPDLVHWQPVSSALEPLPGNHPCYWAPEVTYRDGVFYMYYSVGDEEHMQIRVATSPQPAGPFVDSGRRLTSEVFAIDPHVFEDEDGSWTMFYATDFLDVERVGTGTVMDDMLDPFTLAGDPRPVTRARFDWQIYDPQRKEKGGLRWHTIEGPFVLKHNGRYYQMYSGGNWQRASYGMAYGVSDRLDTEGEWQQPCDGLGVLPLVTSNPQAGVIGPGHNSVVRGLDNRELFCIYHRWQPETEERVLAIDRLGWEGDRLRVYGPSTTPQPDPALPLVSGFERFIASSGSWDQSGNEARLASIEGEAQAEMTLPVGHFLFELSLRSERNGCAWGLSLAGNAGTFLRLAILPKANAIVLQDEAGEQRTEIPAGFNHTAFHLLRIENGQAGVKVSMDGSRLKWDFPRMRAYARLGLCVQQAAAVFAGLAITQDD